MYRVLRFGLCQNRDGLITVSGDLCRCERHDPQLLRFLPREVGVACFRERDISYAM